MEQTAAQSYAKTLRRSNAPQAAPARGLPVVKLTAIEIFLSENPPDVHWDRRMANGQTRIASEEDRNLYRQRAIEQLTGELARRASLQTCSFPA
jgi:hypothetical protein